MRMLISVVALLTLAVTLTALRANDQNLNEEPTIRPDPRPTDLTSREGRGGGGPSDEPRVRTDRRAQDFSTGKRGLVRRDVSGLSFDQTEKIRVIRQRAAEDVQTIRDRERAEIMAVLSDEQRVEFMKLEDEDRAPRARRPTTSPGPTTVEVLP